MQKVEYSEEAMKWVDYYIEMQALNSIINRYGKARSIIGGLERDDYDGFPAQLYADISEHMSRYSNRFQRMCDEEDNIREKIRAGMENMMKGRLYHVESRSERFGVDVYIRVEKVEWKDWTNLTVRGVGVDLDVNYNIIHVADACCDFPVLDADHKPHSLNKPEDNYSGPLADWHPVNHRHYDNTLPRLTEFADDNEVKEELMKRTFAI